MTSINNFTAFQQAVTDNIGAYRSWYNSSGVPLPIVFIDCVPTGAVNFKAKVESKLRRIDPELLDEARYEQKDSLTKRVCDTVYYILSRIWYGSTIEMLQASLVILEVIEELPPKTAVVIEETEPETPPTLETEMQIVLEDLPPSAVEAPQIQSVVVDVLKPARVRKKRRRLVVDVNKPFNDLPLSRENMSDIKKLITILGKLKKNIWFFSNSAKLLYVGNTKIKPNVHSLRFIAFIHKKLKTKILEIKGDPMAGPLVNKWTRFIDGFKNELTELAKKSEFLSYAPGFAKETGLDPEVVKNFFNRNDWDGLIEALFGR
ncbi:MAG: hypothetical protein K1060chlam2_00494 [Chlamydiae bacterium]|nr:hypothetical protein [Chlamydiota bacterium]